MYPFDCISEFIFVETEIEKSDVILVPGGSHSQRMERAVELYKDEYAPHILPSGGVNPKLINNESEWEYLKEIAINLGVPIERLNGIAEFDRANATILNHYGFIYFVN